MPKIDCVKVDAMNAWYAGYQNYPDSKKQYSFSSERVAFEAYWEGWNCAALEADEEAREPYRIIEDEDDA